MKNWLIRFSIFTTFFISYYLLIDILITNFTENEKIRFIIIASITVIFLFFYEKKTINIKRIYNSYKFRTIRADLFDLSKLIQWSTFIIISCFITLLIGHFITSGISRENIGVTEKRFIDIEHSFLMAIDDFRVTFRCADFNSSAKFISRSKEDSYQLINKRRGRGTYDDRLIQKSYLERSEDRIYNDPYAKPVDWMKKVCTDYSQ